MNEKAIVSKEQLLVLFGAAVSSDSRDSDSVFKNIRKDMAVLLSRAENDGEAFAALVAAATHAAWFVQQLVNTQPEKAKQAAMRSPLWPVNITDSKSFPEDLDKLRAQLDIGSNPQGPFKITRRTNKKTWYFCREILILGIYTIDHARLHEGQRKLVAEMFQRFEEKHPGFTEVLQKAPPQTRVQIVTFGGTEQSTAELKKQIRKNRIMFCSYLSRLCSVLKLELPKVNGEAVKMLETAAGGSSLSPLSHTTKDAWLEVLVKVLKSLTNDMPDKSDVLWDIGKYRAAHSEAGDSSTKKTVCSNVWDGIKTRLSSMLDTLLTGELKDGLP